MLQQLVTELEARSAVVRASPVLDGLASRLHRLLGTLTSEPPYFPADKALLSRDGGVCPHDGSRLRFDPDQPFAHRCGRCARWFEGPRHHRAWVTRYQIWLSERAVHLALLGALGAPDLSTRAAAVLTGYAARYRDYPNDDNVLGPSRPFFSTYLESIWLLQLSIALALIDASDPGCLTEAERHGVRTMLAESANLVGSFDEGWSNRQVWNGAALLAAGAVLDNPALQRTGFDHLDRLLRAVDDTGLWHEGENYHFFALRGFLLGAECARWLGADLYADTALGAMYAAPLATLLPDLTLPARGDAPYGVSVAQPRFAELWEMGRARTGDRRLESVLAALYALEVPGGDDHGRRDMAEQEENHPPARQHRDRLGWKALLWMDPAAPRAGTEHVPHGARALPGLAVLRPDPATMITVDAGPRGGGHGHPDLLHLSAFHERPVLADFGTASYVHPSLHWYRSTLAHNAPGVAERGQRPAAGMVEACATDGPWSWCRVRADGLFGPGTWAARSVVTGPSWLLDRVTVMVPDDVWVDLPLHPLEGMAAAGTPIANPARATSDAGHETGYGQLEDVRESPDAITVPFDSAPSLAVRLVPRAQERWLTAEAPGPPGADFGPGAPLRFLIRRARGPGTWTQVVSWDDQPATVEERDGAVHLLAGERRVSVVETVDELTMREGRATVTRFAARPVSAQAPAPAEPPAPADCEIPLWPDGAEPFAGDLPVAEWVLGEDQYRRSERSHMARGGTRADVAVAAQGSAVWVRVRVYKASVVIRAPDAPDPALDNETPDIHSDGVQAYLAIDRWMGVLVLPDLEGGSVRPHPVRGTAAFPEAVTGSSRRMDAGYELRLRLPAGRALRRGERVAFTVTVNEMVAGRERRSGQLAMAGGGWVWLRGDREARHEAVEAEIG